MLEMVKFTSLSQKTYELYKCNFQSLLTDTKNIYIYEKTNDVTIVREMLKKKWVS